MSNAVLIVLISIQLLDPLASLTKEVPWYKLMRMEKALLLVLCPRPKAAHLMLPEFTPEYLFIIRGC